MGKVELTEKDKRIVMEEANISGKIKSITYFSDNEKNYAIVLNKVAGLHAIRLINYKDGRDIKDIKVEAVKRFPSLMGFYNTKVESFRAVMEIKGSQELISQCVHKIETQEDDAENILIVGRTGSGKSTLANVLSSKSSDKLKFEESAGSISHTKTFQVENFEYEGKKYRVVDTVGFGDTKLSKKEVLYKLGEAIYTMKKGISQVFVTIDGRFTKEQIEAFDLVSDVFGKKITEFITIVRTKFEDFEFPDECNKDKEKLKKEKIFSKIINSCNGIIYVDNPPLQNKKNLESKKKDREKSREILLAHLVSCQRNYKLENWDKICVKINDYMNARRWKEDIRGAIMVESELRNVKENVIKEVEVEINLDIPLLAKLQVVVKSKGVDCCSII